MIALTTWRNSTFSWVQFPLHLNDGTRRRIQVAPHGTVEIESAYDDGIRILAPQLQEVTKGT